jgi:hypothetical protein
MYLPTKEEYDRAKEMWHLRFFVLVSFAQHHDHGHNDDNQYDDPFSTGMPLLEEETPPEPLHGSHQQRGETLNEFLVLLREERVGDESREDAQDSQGRLEIEREVELQRQNMDLEEPTVGSAIYEWIRLRSGNNSYPQIQFHRK